MTPTLSEFKIVNCATSIFQNWLVSRFVENIFPDLNFTEKLECQLSLLFARIRKSYKVVIFEDLFTMT